MRIARRLALPLVGAALLAAAAPASARPPDPRCYPHGYSHTYAASARVRVYETSPSFEADTIFYVCDLLTGRRTRIATASGDEDFVSIEQVHFAGRVVAYFLKDCLKAECGGGYRSVDAASGRRLRPQARGALLDWAVFPSGSFAWIDQQPNLRTVGSSRGEHDRGPGIDPRSLAVSGDGRVYWTNAGDPRTAVAGPGGPPDPAVADPPGPRRCYPGGAQTDAATPRIRVYSLTRWSTYTGVTSYFACDLRAGRRVHLVDVPDALDLEALRITGPRVAFAYGSCGRDGCPGGGVGVADTRSGAVQKLAAPRFNVRVTDLTLTASGALAWIERAYGESESTGTVRICDAGACPPVDSGADIASVSLARSRAGALYWTHGDAARSTPLR
jgi:hypothetical protein